VLEKVRVRMRVRVRVWVRVWVLRNKRDLPLDVPSPIKGWG
jgi:hypothetical protein